MNYSDFQFPYFEEAKNKTFRATLPGHGHVK